MTERPRGSARLLTPSKITAWLDCAHYLTLTHEVEAGARPRPEQPFGSFARLLQAMGLAHEAAVLAGYHAEGLRVLTVDGKAKDETFSTWADRSLPYLETDSDLVFQMPFVHDGVRGVADFLERQVDEETGEVRWEPVDAKLARAHAKPGHVLQLCFYAEAIEAITGEAPRHLRVSLGSGNTETVGFEDVRPYWARLRVQLSKVLADSDEDDATRTRAEKCDHCEFCEFQATCEESWRDADSLVFVAGATAKERSLLESSDVATLASLAALTEPVDGVRPERLLRLQRQADLQLQARLRSEDKPPFVLVQPGADPVWGRGFEQMPQPDPADIFLDFEGHPFWRPDRGLFFLFGFVAADESGEWRYHPIWAFDEAEERDGAVELIRYMEDRRAMHPGMHVYHYNHTERSALESLTAQYAVAEGALAGLVERGVFIDLLLVARNAVQVGVEGYGLKHLERLTDYERSREIDKGSGAVVAFDLYCQDGDLSHLDAIAAYNDDDVRATLALRDWLVAQRPADLAWRPVAMESEEEPEDVDDLLDALATFDEGSEQRLLADLLGYWRRERRAYSAPLIGKLSGEVDSQFTDPDVLGALALPEKIDALTPTGRPAKWPTLRLRFPPQPLRNAFSLGPEKVHYLTPPGVLASADVRELDVAAGVVDLVWNEKAQEGGAVPGAVVLDRWVSARSKFETLTLLANQVLNPETYGEPNPVTMALLRGEPPEFREGGGPPDGRFTDGAADLATWVTELESSVLAVQGPPGTGKTYRGAHMVKALVLDNKRVGVMAMSHHAIDNFLGEIADVFAQEPAVELRAVRVRPEPQGGGLPGVTYSNSNKALADPGFDVVSGTAWQFAGRDLLSAPVDVLLIDEAGQLALIDAVVGSMSAGSVVLLGDPQQLPQVAMATHPGGSGASALGHVLGEAETMPDTRGVFIEETWRMHPDVCRFISDRIYQGRLKSHADCARQGTDLGTGLRWLEVNHVGCSTESVEEAEAVAVQIRTLLGQTWTDKQGEVHVIGVDDVMVVAPYNDQVRLLRDHLDDDSVTRGVSVGTVDKFQGRQAPVVLFAMTSSSAADMPRGTEFLFSKNRLNVAISRARCLAYLVCTEQLLHSRAKNVEDMHLIATLCAFVEYADTGA